MNVNYTRYHILIIQDPIEIIFLSSIRMYI